MKSYRELKVWQEAVDLVTEIYSITKSFPGTEVYGLTSQIRRAAVSIPSNIAEGWGRNSTKEYIQFLTTARGSLLALETQLLISCNLGYINKEQLDILSERTSETGRMLNGLVGKLKKRE
jgi:four helix bundle protein